MSAAAAFDVMNRLREAIHLHRQGRLDDARRLYREVLDQVPEQPDALHFLGVLEGQEGRPREALRLMDRAIAVNPRNPAFLYNRANLLRDTGRLHEAVAGYDAVLSLKADNSAALGNRGAALHQLGRYADALESYDRALAFRPGDCDALANRAQTLISLGRPEEALASCEAALAAAPDHIFALCGQGNALAKLGRPLAALAAYDSALSREAGNAELFKNRGIVLMQLRRFADALASYARAMDLDPQDADALYGHASALVELNRHDEAIDAFQHLLKARPDYSYGLGMLVYAQKTACDWRDGSAKTAMIDAIHAGKRATTPLLLLTVSDSAADKLRCAQILIEDKFKPASQALWRGERYAHRRIRVAYLSADFCNHPVSILMAGVFESHDRNRFETMAISTGADDGSDMRARLIQSFDRFIDVREKSDAEIAGLLHGMQTDILIDLTGLTASARPGILAFRPAPVQVNYLGYAGSMGASYVDYVLADRFVIPDEQRSLYAESVVYLPECYMPQDFRRRIAERRPSRVQLGLPEKGFVFASFNNSYKFSPEMFDIWMRLLRTVEGSVLWLPAVNPAAQRNLIREAQERSVGPERIVFAPRMPAAEDHLARLSAADLFLDTFPYNAHTTASDALWAGLPVLTYKGESFASSVAASLLHACGLPELVTESLAAYAQEALDLARDTHALSRVKAKLTGNRDLCALFDTARFTRHLERAYVTMWERSQRGDPPAGFGVEAMGRP
jgi:protein O-GlcNAc transferase